jgi:hypothetical protein
MGMIVSIQQSYLATNEDLSEYFAFHNGEEIFNPSGITVDGT